MQLGQPQLSIDYGTACTRAVLGWPDGRWEPLPVDGAGAAELRGPQAGDEVPTPTSSGLLERRQHLVYRREAARSPFAHHSPPGDHAMAFE